MTDRPGSRSTAQIGKINADALEGKRYTQSPGHQPLPPEQEVGPTKHYTGRPGSNFPDTDSSGHLKNQPDKPPALPHEGKDRKLPG